LKERTVVPAFSPTAWQVDDLSDVMERIFVVVS
jgi:hypothetical protein